MRSQARRLAWSFAIITASVTTLVLIRALHQGKRDRNFALQATCQQLGHAFWEQQLKSEWETASEYAIRIDTNYYSPHGKCYVRISGQMDVDGSGSKMEAHDAVYLVFEKRPLAFQTLFVDLKRTSQDRYTLVESNPDEQIKNRPPNEVYSRKYLSLMELPGLETETKPY